MAATKKHEEIKRLKKVAAKELKEVGEQIKVACAKIPPSVMNGSAQLAVAWREEAEKNFGKIFTMPRSLTLQKMVERVEEAKKTLAFLLNPTV